MKTLFHRIINVGVIATLPLIVIVSCTTSGEPGRSEPVSALENKAEAKATEVSVAPANKVKNKVAETAGKETAVPVKVVDKAKDAAAATAAAPSKQAASKNSIYLGSDGKIAGKGDPNSPSSEAYQIGMSDRPAALAGLPKDKFGLTDWVAVVDQGEIQPLDSLDQNAPVIPPLDLDIIIKAKGDFVKDVLYPHKAHAYWLDCSSCHPAIFIMAKGQNKMSMLEISKGEWCGRCHGKVAFPLADCSRCHTQEKVKKEQTKSTAVK